MASKIEGPQEDVVPNWFLGGERRRLLLEAMTTRPKRGWTIAELKQKTGCGQATAYEVVRVLLDLGLLQPPDQMRRYRLEEEHRLAKPLRNLLRALRPYASRAVPRPARGARRT
ncbi:MAG: hypothetical protein WBM00_09760 [Solirubrobacterales bacterium]